MTGKASLSGIMTDFYAFILELIHKYQLDPPELFRNNEIDRTALLFYNTDKKVDDYVFSHNLIC